MSNVIKSVLPNGVRVLVEPLDHVQSVAVGLWCGTGSAHEEAHEAGITHFIEHMLFKGTVNRTAKEIAESIEGRGGVLNAFTDKERTCYYARCLADDINNTVEVLSDMATHSLLDPEEIEREKGVVLEEIKMGDDEPSDKVHDLHYSARWGDHPFGKPVIGTSESVSSFDGAAIRAYMARRYHANRIVITASGKLDPEEFTDCVREFLGDLEPGGPDPKFEAPVSKVSTLIVPKEIEQVHFCIGSDGPDVYADDLYAASVLEGLLGGNMSSRLFQEIRERRGLAYNIGTYQVVYTSGGAFTVTGGTSKKHWDLVQELVRHEFDRIIEEGPTSDELERVKRSIKGHMVLALEGLSSRMRRLAVNEFNHGRDVPIEETIAKIDAVTEMQLVETARKLLAPEMISTTAIVPQSGS